MEDGADGAGDFEVVVEGRGCVDEDIGAGLNPVGVTEYFGELYDANYRDAAQHDRPDRVIFVEGAQITLHAHIVEYPLGYHDALLDVVGIGAEWKPDCVIVLTSSTATIFPSSWWNWPESQTIADSRPCDTGGLRRSHPRENSMKGSGRTFTRRNTAS